MLVFILAKMFWFKWRRKDKKVNAVLAKKGIEICHPRNESFEVNPVEDRRRSSAKDAKRNQSIFIRTASLFSGKI